MAELTTTLRGCVERAQRYRALGRPISEANTRIGLIDPILRKLGWDTLNPDEVDRERRPDSSKDSMDYALLHEGALMVVIEAKRLGEKLGTWSANQTLKYAAPTGVTWVALTNGARWQVYNAYAPGPADKKLFFAVDIDKVETASRLLSLLSKDSLGKDHIGEKWTAFCIDRQVHPVLDKLFNGPQPSQDLVELIGRQMTGIAKSQVRASLSRVRATFDFDSSVPPPVAAGTATTETLPVKRSPDGDRPPKRTSRTPKVTAEEKRLTLRDLQGAGRLAPGATLRATYYGQQVTAELLDDWRIRFRGSVYNSPSGAGEAAKVAIRGPEIPETVRATDGLDFWQVEDLKTGEVVSLKELRRRTAADLAGK